MRSKNADLEAIAGLTKTTASLPRKPGHYWARWKIKSPGTAEEDDPPGGDWEVVQVFRNCIDESDPEYLMVAVAGVERSQSIENFFWGDRVPEPAGVTVSDWPYA